MAKKKKDKEEPRLVDVNRLMTVRNYADKHHMNRATLYYQIQAGKLAHEKIDGVCFIYKN